MFQNNLISLLVLHCVEKLITDVPDCVLVDKRRGLRKTKRNKEIKCVRKTHNIFLYLHFIESFLYSYTSA